MRFCLGFWRPPEPILTAHGEEKTARSSGLDAPEHDQNDDYKQHQTEAAAP